MAEKRTPEDAGPGRDPEIGAAELLFRDDPARRSARPADQPAAKASADTGSGEVFALAGGSSVEIPTMPPVPPIPAASDRAPTRERVSSRSRETPTRRTSRDEESSLPAEDAVDEVWSRGAEWGVNLAMVGGWLLGLAVIVYLLLGWGVYAFAFLILVLGLAGAALLSYPIIITLERPVRMTPEQAVRDYYAALSHHVPHYRRMWLLLARNGRTSSSYGSFEGFKGYWNDTLRTLKGSRAGALTPLVFEVEDYHGEKSAGKSRVDGKFTLKVSIRGQRQAGPVASIAGQVSFVRGPDKMWYLENGALPRPARERRSESTRSPEGGSP